MSTPQYNDNPTERLGTSGGARGSATAGVPVQRPTEPISRPQPTYLSRETQPMPLQPRTPEERTWSPTRQEVLAMQLQEFGGVKVGAAFFGWVVAIAMAVLLSAVAAGILALLTLGGITPTIEPGDDASGSVAAGATALGLGGIVGAIIAGVVILLAFFCGGYVAGRMARFNGVRQGLAVWVWSVAISILVGVAAAVFGRDLAALPGGGTLTGMDFTGPGLPTAIITLAATLVLSLVGAVLGGISGTRFHRRVDRIGLGR